MSYDELKDRGVAFIISRIKAEFYEPVRTYDSLDVYTYPCDSRGYSFIRCYEIKRNGAPVGRAISVWALVDIGTRSLIKVNDFELGLETKEALDLTLNPTRMPDTICEVGKYTVRYSDIDRNNHINNTKYSDIYANFLPMKNARIAEITISYVNEAVFGEELTVFRAEADGYYYLRTVKSDGKINSEAKIRLEQI
jgi:acyl-ACP thioesterase